LSINQSIHSGFSFYTIPKWLVALFFVCLALPSNAQFFFGNETLISLKLSKIITLIDRYYVDTVNENKLAEKAIVSMLKELDPHSQYIPKEEVKEMNEPLEGNFEGIGVTFNLLDDTIFVISPIAGGPSEKVGILAGDRIVLIEGQNVAGIGMTSKQVRDRLLGPKGTRVKVGVKRRGVNEILDFVIVRDKIPIYSLDAVYMVDDSIGYIKFNRFAKTTQDEFNLALDSLNRLGCKDLILDLSGNGGGYLEIAVRLTDNFLRKGEVIVYTEGVNSPRYDYNATSDGLFEKGRLIVIIDEGSASASEILAGAIQDWDRGLVVGRRSFGKGLVQRAFEMPDSSLVRLTIARYYTPSGRCIQKPYAEGYDEYEKDISTRYAKGEFLNEDSIHLSDSLRFFTLRSKRKVYGGGGIMPDYFIPYDTSGNSKYFRELLAKGILHRFVLNYVDDNRKQLRKLYPVFSLFDTGFVITTEFRDKLIKYAENNDLPFNEKDYAVSGKEIELLIKAYIARDIWTTSEFYKVLNTSNNSISKAIAIMRDTETYYRKLSN